MVTNNYDKLISLKNSNKKNEKIIDYYINTIKINDWLNNDKINSIIFFKDRKEFKKYNKYHRINGPAIDFSDPEKDVYYYKGKLFENKKEWEKETIKVLRKIKLKNLKKI